MSEFKLCGGGDEIPDPRESARDPGRLFATFFERMRSKRILSVTGSVLLSLTALVIAFLAKCILDHAIPQGDIRELALLGALLLGIPLATPGLESGLRVLGRAGPPERLPGDRARLARRALRRQQRRQDDTPLPLDGAPPALGRVGNRRWRSQRRTRPHPPATFVRSRAQHPFLFEGSVRENVAYGIEGISAERFERAARMAFAHDFITGYDTQVGNDGVLLSGGQHQPIALARALLRERRVPFLNEPTNHRDPETRAEMFRRLGVLEDTTVVVIRHDRSALTTANQQIEVAGGRLVTRLPTEAGALPTPALPKAAAP